MHVCMRERQREIETDIERDREGGVGGRALESKHMEVREQLGEIHSLLPCMSPREGAHVVVIGDNHLYTLSHLMGF